MSICHFTITNVYVVVTHFCFSIWTRRYRSLPSGSTFPCTVAELPVNAELNRFPHLLAYDHSRVKLERPESDDDDSDYINANYVPGYDRRRKAYIAAQSPFNERTICDFWLMVYQQRVTKVTTASCLLDVRVARWVNPGANAGDKRFRNFHCSYFLKGFCDLASL